MSTTGHRATPTRVESEASTQAFPVPCVAVVTDRSVCGGADAMLEAVEAAVAGGVDLVQLREKDLPDAEQLLLDRRLRALTAGRALLFVNDSVSIALAAGADGVQLSERSRTVSAARAAMGEQPLLVGRSVHSPTGGQQAADEGADFLVAGAVFETPAHSEHAPAGVALVSDIVGSVGIPVLGIGGITAASAPEVIGAGAAGVAVVREVLAAEDPGAAARALRAAVQHAWAARSMA